MQFSCFFHLFSFCIETYSEELNWFFLIMSEWRLCIFNTKEKRLLFRRQNKELIIFSILLKKTAEKMWALILAMKMNDNNGCYCIWEQEVSSNWERFMKKWRCYWQYYVLSSYEIAEFYVSFNYNWLPQNIVHVLNCARQVTYISLH